MKIKDLPKETRPREKALQFGIETLSDSELLALLIGSGVKDLSAIEIANELLRTYHSMYSLANANFLSLKTQKGLNKIKTLNLLAVFEFHNRLNSPLYKKQEAIKNTEELYMRYTYIEDFTNEVMILVMLNSKKNIIKEKFLYRGTEDSVNVSVKEILSEVLIANAKGFYIIHNHPGGDPTPSEQDVNTTNVLKDASIDMEIHFIDHLIIAKNGYYSFFEDDLVKNMDGLV